MLCNNCGEDNSIGRTRCLICSASLGDEPKERHSIQPKTQAKVKNKATTVEIIGSWVGVLVSIVIFNSLADSIFPPRIDGGLDYVEMICAGIAGGIGGAIGMKIAKRFN